MEERSCCFIGHRRIIPTRNLKENLLKAIERVIVDKGVNKFFFGSKSEFNSLCYAIVTELRQKYSSICRVYVRAEFPYINDSYREYLLQKYEDTYYPQEILHAGRAVYVERNCYMIDRCRYCVVYYHDAYIPEAESRRKHVLQGQGKSGTRLAYEYAHRKHRIIINLFE